jgi:hypothetical protein
MKYLKSINESIINYEELLVEIYENSFKQAFEQNKNLKKEIEDIEDIFIDVFDDFNEYPKEEYALYFYDNKSESLVDFRLRIWLGDLEDNDSYEDYKYFSKILVMEDIEVYFLVFYSFESKYSKDLINYGNKENIDKKLIDMDFEPLYFSKIFGDPMHIYSIGCYKKINLNYKFDLEYLSKFPDAIKNDIHRFNIRYNLNEEGLEELSLIINKL